MKDCSQTFEQVVYFWGIYGEILRKWGELREKERKVEKRIHININLSAKGSWVPCCGGGLSDLRLLIIHLKF